MLPSDGSFVGARINYSNNSDADGELYVVLPDAAQVLPLTVAPVPEGYSLEEIYSNDGHQNPFMVTVDGQLFLGRTLNGNSGNPGMLQFLRVEVNGGTARRVPRMDGLEPRPGAPPPRPRLPHPHHAVARQAHQ